MHAQPISTHSFKNRGSSMCLDVYGASTANEAPLIQWPCTGTANQRFVERPLIEEHESPSGVTFLEVSYDGQCLHVAGGGKLIQWPCDFSFYQKFKLESTRGGYMKIKTLYTNQCLTTNGSTMGAQVTQTTCVDGDLNQEFSAE
jgi:hypothetical protein